MSHTPKYVPVEATMSPFPAISAGKSGVPEAISGGGAVSALAKLLFSTNFAIGDSLTFGAITVTAVAANPTYLQFVPGVSLAASLAALVTQFQGLSMPVAGTYSVTDTNTSITFTPTGYGYTSAGWTYTTPAQVTAVKTSGGTNTPSQAGGVSKVLLSTNFAAADSITVDGVTLTAVAANPTPAQFIPGLTLAATLATLAAQFATQFSFLKYTFSVTDTATSLSVTSVAVASAVGYAVSAVKTSGGTNTPTQSTNLGTPLTNISLDTEHTQVIGAGSFDIYLRDGDESQKKSIAMLGTGTVNVKGANLPGTTVNYALNGNDALVLQFLSAKWRLILNDGAVAS